MTKNSYYTMYINPIVVANATRVLEKYAQDNPDVLLPLFEVAKNEPEQSRAAYVRAAQRLKWNVTRTRGHVYENGYFIW